MPRWQAIHRVNSTHAEMRAKPAHRRAQRLLVVQRKLEPTTAPTGRNSQSQTVFIGSMPLGLSRWRTSGRFSDFLKPLALARRPMRIAQKHGLAVFLRNTGFAHDSL